MVFQELLLCDKLPVPIHPSAAGSPAMETAFSVLLISLVDSHNSWLKKDSWVQDSLEVVVKPLAGLCEDTALHLTYIYCCLLWAINRGKSDLK